MLGSDLAQRRLRHNVERRHHRRLREDLCAFSERQCADVNAKHLRGSAWLNFNRVLCEAWSTGKRRTAGRRRRDCAFSVGSGSKLALESAIALAELFAQ